VVGVGRSEPHPAGDAVDVGVDGEHSSPPTREQEHTVRRLRADTLHRQQRLAHLVRGFLPDEPVESTSRTVLVERPLGRADDDLGLLVVQSGRGDGLGEFV
jgi:hypothetical protein